MVKFWLVIHLLLPGSPPVVLSDEEQPDLATCWMVAQDAVDRVLKFEAPFEFAASCAVQKVLPAGEPA